MRHTASLWIAAASCVAALFALNAATRPRYGGALRVELRASIRSLDPAPVAADLAAADPAVAAVKVPLAGLVFETLVTLDARREARPALATAWTHEPARKRWVFAPRTNVVLHTGAAWQPSVLAVPDDQPIEEILRTLAKPASAIVIREPDGSLVGTGPFRIASFEAGKSASLAAHEAHWRGRPYVDEVRITMGRAYADQAVDFEAGKADVIEIPLTDLRRASPRDGRAVTSRFNTVLALVSDQPLAANIRSALAKAVDRTAIHSVLLQKQGEISGALLPQWLSGYAFLFAEERDRAAVRQLAGSGVTLTFAYDRQDPLLRSIAQRIELNASEAGITLKVVPSGNADLRLVSLPISGVDPRSALEDIAAFLKSKLQTAGELYDAERALLDEQRVIPLFHVPVAFRLSPSVRDWQPGRVLPLDDVWIQP